MKLLLIMILVVNTHMNYLENNQFQITNLLKILMKQSTVKIKIMDAFCYVRIK